MNTFAWNGTEELLSLLTISFSSFSTLPIAQRAPIYSCLNILFPPGLRDKGKCTHRVRSKARGESPNEADQC